MHIFLTDNRAELLARCEAKAAQRALPGKPHRELESGIGVFLDQVIKGLFVAQGDAPMAPGNASSAAVGGTPGNSEANAAATLHGKELLAHGFTIQEVVHDYCDLCQAIADLACETGTRIGVDEFRALNRCVDNAIASAVTEFDHQRDALIADRQAVALNERLGLLAHELRNRLCTATLALSIIKQGNLGLNGATGAVLDRSLVGLGRLIDSSLAEVRVTAGLEVRHRLISLADFIAEIKLSATLEAEVKECAFTVSDVDPLLAVDVDRDLLLAATGNLLQNAFKFTHPHTEVSLSAHALGDRILIDVQDHCGGLPPGFDEEMFKPFTQGSGDRSGLGLGLSVARRSVEANWGSLSVRNLPGTGCVFTIDLPRHSVLDMVPVVGTA